MMSGRGKSDSVIVAEKPTNKAGRPAAEPVERRAGAEGNAVQQSTRRAQDRESVSQALDRIQRAARQRKNPKSAIGFWVARGRWAGCGFSAHFASPGERRYCGWPRVDTSTDSVGICEASWARLRRRQLLFGVKQRESASPESRGF